MIASLSAAPESPLDLVARGDFSKLSLPILVAAGSARDIESFRDRHGMLDCEVRRYRKVMDQVPDNKVLILLPGWEDHRPTDLAVLQWVRADRYTVEMDDVRAPVRSACPELLWMALGLAVVLATWLTLAWLGGR
jgi:hypothetical protein